jgi:zinc D-Ala-D-Ala carboxypeptidase
VCQQIIDAGIAFDQLIREGTWVHLGLADAGKQPRREVLTAVLRPGQSVRYVKGLA